MPQSIDPTPEQSALRVLEALPEAIFHVTSDAKILYYKPSAMNLMRVESGRELMGKSVFAMPELTSALDEELLESIGRRVQLAIERNAPQRFEIQLKNAQWPVWLEFRAFKAGEHEAVLAIRDISHERRERINQQHELSETRALVAELYREQDEHRAELASRVEALAARTEGTLRSELLALSKDITHPARVEPMELQHALERSIDEICSKDLETKVRLELTPEHLTVDAASCVHQIVEDALQCVSEQADAKRVRVSLVNTAEMLSLMISDDIPEEQSLGQDRAICIAKLRHHAETLGGSLRVTAGRRGTAMRLRLPLSAT